MEKKLKVPVTARFHDALAYASKLHAAQARKSTEIPYISHLLAVASIVLEAGGSEEEAIAALLHDAAEDQGGLATLALVRDKYGPGVAEIVEACSDTFEVPKPAWDERKRLYAEHLRQAGISALLVSAADKLHNARATLRDLRRDGATVWARFSATPAELLANYETLIGVYETAARDPRRAPLASELREVVEQMKAFDTKVPLAR